MDLQTMHNLVEAVTLPTRDNGIVRDLYSSRPTDNFKLYAKRLKRLQKVVVAITPLHLCLKCQVEGVTCEAWALLPVVDQDTSRVPAAFKLPFWKLKGLLDNAPDTVRTGEAAIYQLKHAAARHVHITYRPSNWEVSIQLPPRFNGNHRDGNSSPATTPGGHYVLEVEPLALDFGALALPQEEEFVANFVPEMLGRGLHSIRCAITTRGKFPHERWVRLEPDYLVGNRILLAARFRSEVPMLPQGFSISAKDAAALRAVMRRCPPASRIEVQEGRAIIRAAGFRCSVDCSNNHARASRGMFEADPNALHRYSVRRELLQKTATVARAFHGPSAPDYEPGKDRAGIELVVADLSDLVGEEVPPQIPRWLVNKARSGLQRLREQCENAKVIVVGARRPGGDKASIFVDTLALPANGCSPIGGRYSLASFEQALASSEERLELVCTDKCLLLTSRNDQEEIRFVLPQVQE